MNRVRFAAVAAVAALALAGCATSTPGSGQVAADAKVPASGAPTKGPSGAAPPTTSASASGRPTPSPIPPGTKTVTLNQMTVPLIGVSKVSKQGQYLCITLINDTGCSLEIIDIKATRAEGGSVSNPSPSEQDGWWWGSDVPSCGDGTTTSSAMTGSKLVEHGLKPVGSKRADYGYWLVTCQNSDLNFDPRVWWLPTSQIAFREHDTVAGSGEAVDKILSAVTFG